MARPKIKFEQVPLSIVKKIVKGQIQQPENEKAGLTKKKKLNEGLLETESIIESEPQWTIES